jgi:hypothetical protein
MATPGQTGSMQSFNKKHHDDPDLIPYVPSITLAPTESVLTGGMEENFFIESEEKLDGFHEETSDKYNPFNLL